MNIVWKKVGFIVGKETTQCIKSRLRKRLEEKHVLPYLHGGQSQQMKID